MSKSALTSSGGLRPKVLVPTISMLMENKEPFLLRGSPGIGKTDMILKAAGLTYGGKGMEVHISHPVVSDPTDYKGMPTVENGEANFLPFGDLKKLITAKKPLLFFMDDLGQASPSVQAAAMQLLLSRTIDGKKVSDCVTFAAATNNKSDKAGVTGILEPVKSRFTTILGVQVNVDDWIAWALEKCLNGVQKIPDELVAYIKWRPENLNNFQPTAEIVNTPCPRTIAALGRLVRLSKELESNAKYCLFEGAVGAGVAAEFVAFQSIYKNLVPPEIILRDPKKLPKVDDTKLDVNYAMVISLSSAVTKETLANYFLILKEYRKDLEVMGLNYMSTVHPELQETEEYTQWCIDNQNIWVK